MAKPIYFYGTHAVQSLLEHRPTDALSLFIQQGKESDNSIAEILALAQSFGVSIQYAGKDKLANMCNSPQHQGVVLHARPLNFATEATLDTVIAQDNCLLLVLDQITDAHNFGACIRSAVAMNVDAIICPRKNTAPLTATVAKVAVGAAESIPVIAVGNLARTLNQLKDAGVFVYGTALDDTAKPLHECDFTIKTAIVMGSEGEGMRRLTTDTCDQLVYIPMGGDVQSLNVSVATGMALYEASRQRFV
ncbi:23S rRNA (guanosine(2251)-2'-O)-methyltransferase RlmB [Psychrobacter sp. HD31]|uniref:23S rRNA (guanosine(2251)-2'-O)-methyltransferase RlmB n=1 Tax=Psychrobacter sp. HD31 TaxID=3112003 RepID=UPI003DA63D15